jgi:hypothetical protein
MRHSNAATTQSVPEEARSTLRWWQWVLMYPTLLITAIPAIFQFIQWGTAINYKLPIFGNTIGALDQLHSWERNSECLKDHDIDHLKPKSPTEYEIDLLPCPSGDVLVTLTPIQSPDHPVNRWIITRSFFGQSAQGFFVTSAVAQNMTQPDRPRPNPVRVIGTMQQGTTIIKRTQLSDGTCIDHTIDGLTGRQLNQRNASCAPF